MSCAPLNFQISKLVMIETQFAKTNKTYFHFLFSTKSNKISKQNVFMQENTTLENISNDLTRWFHETKYTTMIFSNKNTKILEKNIFCTLSFLKQSMDSENLEIALRLCKLPISRNFKRICAKIV